MNEFKADSVKVFVDGEELPGVTTPHRALNWRQVRELESVRAAPTRRALPAGASVGEGPERSHVGRGTRISK